MLEQASLDCTTDTDCTFVSWRLGCVPDCDNRFRSMPVAGAVELEQQIRQVDDSFCSEFEQRDCFVLGLPCKLAPGALERSRPVCQAGQCSIGADPLR